ncbi:hypothetical protein [Burkholderia ubonensis]|uniref:hypothetical protein n=1 Tax=Burkholderia ubonensis TaxID=101571 RepID=UPI001055238E|nr:hypothetical protein [Burkholderia ubonensis]
MDPNGLLGDVPPRAASKKPAQATSPARDAGVPAVVASPPVVDAQVTIESPVLDLAPADALPNDSQQDVDVEAVVPVRVLVKCVYGMPNDVVDLPEVEAQIATRAGQVCDQPASVVFARALRR